MRNLLVTAAALLVAAAPALAGTYVPGGTDLGVYQASSPSATGAGSPTRIQTEVYDDWRAAAQGGVSVLQGLYVTDGLEVGDRLFMTGGGYLDDMGISFANVNGPAGSTMTGFSSLIRFYDGPSGVQIGTTILANAAGLPALGPGSSIRLSFGAGSLLPIGNNLPSDIYVTIQFTAVTATGGAGLANAGVQVRNPLNTGASPDAMYNFPGAVPFNFGGNPVANECFFIKVNDQVPEPATLSLLALGGLALLRRR